jgi:hypothetical protein
MQATWSVVLNGKLTQGLPLKTTHAELLTELKQMNNKFVTKQSKRSLHASVQVVRKAIARTDHQLQEQRRSLGKLVSYKNLRAALVSKHTYSN